MTNQVTKDTKACPDCGANWDAGDVYETLRNSDLYKDETDEQVRESAAHYGWSETNKVRFSNLIGLYSIERDRTFSWQCPKCNHTWPR